MKRFATNGTEDDTRSDTLCLIGYLRKYNEHALLDRHLNGYVEIAPMVWHRSMFLKA